MKADHASCHKTEFAVVYAVIITITDRTYQICIHDKTNYVAKMKHMVSTNKVIDSESIGGTHAPLSVAQPYTILSSHLHVIHLRV